LISSLFSFDGFIIPLIGVYVNRRKTYFLKKKKAGFIPALFFILLDIFLFSLLLPVFTLTPSRAEAAIYTAPRLSSACIPGNLSAALGCTAPG
jgi:hypothetical protein